MARARATAPSWSSPYRASTPASCCWSGAGGGGTLLSVYEKYSFDNAAEAGLEGGLICSVLRYSRWELEQLLTGDMSGCAVFARDEDELGERYYLLYTPHGRAVLPASGGGVADTESDEFAPVDRAQPDGAGAGGGRDYRGQRPHPLHHRGADCGLHIRERRAHTDTLQLHRGRGVRRRGAHPLPALAAGGRAGYGASSATIDAERNVHLCFPGAVGEEARDYYDRAQRRVDAGEEQWRLEPLEVARDFVENSGEWPEPPLDRGSYEIMD